MANKIKAVRKGVEREFSETQWNMLGPNKQGWVEKTAGSKEKKHEVPSEVKSFNAGKDEKEQEKESEETKTSVEKPEEKKKPGPKPKSDPKP